ncbi:uncharacterized protein LY79DRAFT_204562 [Colletotrichum navitas]|uniref:Secreted protein n=1 Tax=Colletotrichum navitas TaxID=681940 RepID=A0AAD8QBK3_9PEZI|nr:uncharacterized protein LY79DRAFT_204562 [Colletotrichum navitas]KAK1598976.1 hypothetical protein LY79DRAFT_204562 [Colletotrichum navitas]
MCFASLHKGSISLGFSLCLRLCHSIAIRRAVFCLSGQQRVTCICGQVDHQHGGGAMRVAAAVQPHQKSFLPAPALNEG